MNNNENLAKLAVRKSLLKEYKNFSNERIVYINDNTEFQIEVYNPYNYVIGVSFSFNNNYQGNSHLLVVRPGERIWLDRYLDNDSKLLFSTYKVNNTAQNRDAIRDNGNLVIKFFKEDKHDWKNNIYINNIETYDWSYPKPIDVWYNNNPLPNYTTSVTNSNVTSANYTCSAASTTDSHSFYASSTPLSCKTNFSDKIETGRIEKGSRSNQRLKDVNMDFEFWPFRTETIHILPSSQKPVTSNDLKKKYCVECGRKISPKYKYCPFCGAKI